MIHQLKTLPDKIDLKDLSFTSEVKYGKIVFENKRLYPLLQIISAEASDLILCGYFLTFIFDASDYDDEIDGYRRKMTEELNGKLLEDFTREEYEDKIKACELRKQRAIEENPNMYIKSDLEKYERKRGKDGMEHHRYFRVSTLTAMMMMSRKSTFEKYQTTFEVPKDQEETKINFFIM